MKFTIHHTEVRTPGNGLAVGVETQPPLDEVGASGVVTELTRQKEGYGTGREHLADAATITRNTEAGTVLLVHPNEYRRLSSETVAEAVGRLIDPCGIHDITYNSPLGRN